MKEFAYVDISGAIEIWTKEDGRWCLHGFNLTPAIMNSLGEVVTTGGDVQIILRLGEATPEQNGRELLGEL